LAPELQLEIFKHLDPGTLICFGLTCKRLYAIHREFHGTVKLNHFIWFSDSGGEYATTLGYLLSKWAGDDMYYVDYQEEICKFRKRPSRWELMMKRRLEEQRSKRQILERWSLKSMRMWILSVLFGGSGFGRGGGQRSVFETWKELKARRHLAIHLDDINTVASR
jgi:hypothetical protein